MTSNSISASFKLPMMSLSWSSPNSWLTFENRTMRFDVKPFFPLTNTHTTCRLRKCHNEKSTKINSYKKHGQCTNCHYLNYTHYSSLLRSFNTNLLTIPFTLTALVARSFPVASPKIWNSLPPALHSCNCPNTFHWHLKTRYFQRGISSSRNLSPCSSDSAFC